MAVKKNQDVEVEVNKDGLADETKVSKKTAKKPKIEAAIAKLCQAQIDKLKSAPKLDGQVLAIEKATEILNLISEGKGFDDLKPIFKEMAESGNRIPGSLSQFGAWFSTDIQRNVGRIIDSPVVIVRVAGGLKRGDQKEYQELAMYEITNNQSAPADMPRFVGSIAKCWICDEEFAVKEPAHQLYCPKCESLYRKNRRSGGGVALTKLNNEEQALHSMAKAAFRHRQGQMATTMLTGLNAKREAAGKSSLTEAQFKKADTPEALMA
jgi:hypothetical protein